MSNTFQASSGLDPDTFPVAVPTYLGHYHKPQVVGKNGQPTNIRYVGSPYQGMRFLPRRFQLARQPAHPHARTHARMRISYLGAVSREELGQQKKLLVLDEKWQVVLDDCIPIDVGPRHFSASGATVPVPGADTMRPGDRFPFALHASSTYQCYQ